jgi:hypothetical protein
MASNYKEGNLEALTVTIEHLKRCGWDEDELKGLREERKRILKQSNVPVKE